MQNAENIKVKSNRCDDQGNRVDTGMVMRITLSALVALQFVWFFLLGGVFYGYIDAVKTVKALQLDLAQAENKLTALAGQIGTLETSIAQEMTKQKTSANQGSTIPEFSLLKQIPHPLTLNHESAPQRSAAEAPMTRPKDLPTRNMGLHSSQYHQVNVGETLYQISKRYNISVGEICQLNNLKDNQPIRPGQKLIVSPIKTQLLTAQ